MTRKSSGTTLAVVVTAVTLLTLLGTALRFYRLNSELWFDEISTLVNSVRFPIAEIVTHFPSNNQHTLYSILAHVSVTLLGEEPWSLRLPAVVFGVFAIPLLYLLGTRVTSRLEALLAASMLTVSYHHVWFSQNARAYTLLTFAVLSSTVVLLRWIEDKSRPLLAAYVVIAALGSYAHLTMVLVVVSHAFVCGWMLFEQRQSHLIFRQWRDLLLTFVSAGVLTILLYLPMLDEVIFFFTRRTASSSEVATLASLAVSAVRGLQMGFGMLWVVMAGAVVFVAGAWSYFVESRVVAYLFILPIPFTVALAVLMQRPLYPRFVFFAIGFGILVAVRGARVTGEWFAGFSGGRLSPQQGGVTFAILLTLAAVAFSIGSLPYGYRYPKQAYLQAVNFVEERKPDADLVALIERTAERPVRDYLGRNWPRIESGEELQRMRASGRDVWVFYTFPAVIQARHPALWEMVEDCRAMNEFPGTVEDGAIHVRRCPPTAQ